MPAVACLRVDVSAQQTQLPPATLAALVHKFTVSYLEMRWAWPRRFVSLTEVSALLTDPRVDDLDLSELQRLSENLQHHLFGAGEEGDVSLLVFEGDTDAVTAFAAMSATAVAEALQNPALLPHGGRITRIRAGAPLMEVMSGQGPRAAEACEPVATAHWVFDAAPPPPPAWEGVQGIYFMPREIFFGDVVMYMPLKARRHLSLVDGPDHMPPDAPQFDAECVGVAVRRLAQRRMGPLLYLPISFTSLVRPSLRCGYETLLEDLPLGRRGELAAAIYDVPRDPAFTGLKQAKAMLDPHVSAIDLRTSDPEFEIEKLPAQLVTSVTFILPNADPMVRLSSLRRFADRLAHYKQRRIWPAVSNVRRQQELEAAARMGIPFVTGPAVCTPRQSPIGGHAVPLRQLPVTAHAGGGHFAVSRS